VPSSGRTASASPANGLGLVLVRTGSSQRISFNSARFKASGKVVRGHFQIVA
jgi:hypothetical protein